MGDGGPGVGERKTKDYREYEQSLVSTLSLRLCLYISCLFGPLGLFLVFSNPSAFPSSHSDPPWMINMSLPSTRAERCFHLCFSPDESTLYCPAFLCTCLHRSFYQVTAASFCSSDVLLPTSSRWVRPLLPLSIEGSEAERARSGEGGDLLSSLINALCSRHLLSLIFRASRIKWRSRLHFPMQLHHYRVGHDE